MTILDKIAERTKLRVARDKEKISPDEMRRLAFTLPRKNFPFEVALKKPELSFICECKKASPSKGLIAENFPHVEIAKAYEAAGADAISVLTEPEFFLGADNFLLEIAREVSIPCLRKDFVVDAYQIFQAKTLGASAVLLICSILDDAQLKNFLATCDELGLSALVEAHDEREIARALNCGARIIGVNNRNLKDFTVDMNNAKKLRAMVPREKIFVSESGVQNSDDVKKIRELGADAVLIGEVLMRAADKKSKLDELKG
ncbi:MAG: indole-3-glycerol phosphate synthase TrpC, partial [Selenomonadaceae bacterium]|nr:indole-3-glycerol phosphate synthase TrpC [Selenomonadaceae bacterium]